MPTNYMQQAHCWESGWQHKLHRANIEAWCGGEGSGENIYKSGGVEHGKKAICQWLCMKNAWAKFCSWRVKDWVTSVSVEDFNSLLFTMHWEGPKIFTFVMLRQ